MWWEVEQKFRVDGFDSVTSALEALGVTLAAGVIQTDLYFQHPARDFSQTDEALRLRQEGACNLVTYKGPKVDSTTKTRQELEIPLATGVDRIEQYRELLESLSFRYVATVRKTRRVGEIDTNGWKVEVALDAVEDLGSFVELETEADSAALDDARAALASLARQLSLTHVERRSYLELLLDEPPR